MLGLTKTGGLLSPEQRQADIEQHPWKQNAVDLGETAAAFGFKPDATLVDAIQQASTGEWKAVQIALRIAEGAGDIANDYILNKLGFERGFGFFSDESEYAERKSISRSLDAAQIAFEKHAPPDHGCDAHGKVQVAPLKERLKVALETAAANNRGRLPHETYDATRMRDDEFEPPASWVWVRAADRLLKGTISPVEFTAQEILLRSGDQADVTLVLANQETRAFPSGQTLQAGIPFDGRSPSSWSAPHCCFRRVDVHHQGHRRDYYLEVKWKLLAESTRTQNCKSESR